MNTNYETSPQFLRLTVNKIYGIKDGTPVLINVAHIIAIAPLMDGDGCIVLAEQSDYQVDETFDDIIRALKSIAGIWYPCLSAIPER